jgi:hypothetical protein
MHALVVIYGRTKIVEGSRYYIYRYRQNAANVPWKAIHRPRSQIMLKLGASWIDKIRQIRVHVFPTTKPSIGVALEFGNIWIYATAH